MAVQTTSGDTMESGTTEAQTVEDFDQAAAAFDAQFGEAVTLSEPDCPTAADLRDRMCELAGRVCEIAERYPEDSDLEARCTDGGERCGRARSSVDEHCPE